MRRLHQWNDKSKHTHIYKLTHYHHNTFLNCFWNLFLNIEPCEPHNIHLVVVCKYQSVSSSLVWADSCPLTMAIIKKRLSSVSFLVIFGFTNGGSRWWFTGAWSVIQWNKSPHTVNVEAGFIKGSKVCLWEKYVSDCLEHRDRFHSVFMRVHLYAITLRIFTQCHCLLCRRSAHCPTLRERVMQMLI